MIKKGLLLATAALFAAGLVLGGTAVAKDKGPAEIVLKTAKAKKPVKFPHAKHQGMMECDTCHKSSHFAPAADKWTKKDGHALCKDCHKKMKKEGKKAPTKCNGCHIKKKKRKLEGC